MITTPGVFAAVAALAGVLVDARRLEIPKPTASFVLPLDGISPRPTAPPALHDLRRRLDSSSTQDETVLVAPDNTCGYISGRAGAGYTCGNSATCIFYTSSSTRPGRVACCDDAGCNLRAACIDYDGFYSSSQCDDGCAVDVYTLKCIQSTAPFCNTVSFDGGIIDYWCNGLDISVPQAAQTTYSGEKDHSFSKLALNDETSTSLVFTNTDSSAANAGPTVSADPTGSDNSNGNGSGDNGNNSNSNSGDSSGSHKSSTPVGPIVGGVVGGVAAIALVGAALFFFLRRKKGNKADPAAAPPMQQQGPPPPQGYNSGVPPNGAPPVAYYDPKYAASTSTAQTPYSPGQQYAQPGTQPGTQPGGFYAVSSQHTGSPDPHNPVSPTGSHMTDPRMSQAGTSPSPSYGAPAYPPGQQGFAPQGAVIHEASTTTTDDHHGGMHELA